jgi:hypothetical protein
MAPLQVASWVGDASTKGREEQQGANHKVRAR